MKNITFATVKCTPKRFGLEVIDLTDNYNCNMMVFSLYWFNFAMLYQL